MAIASSSPPPEAEAFAEHDHRQCQHQALRHAEDACAQQGARLTSVRRRVLELLWESHQPQTAYELLHRLEQQDGRPVAPPTVYRALEFLQAHGLAHRLASLNAFIGCSADCAAEAGNGRRSLQFLICQGCHHVAELHSPRLESALSAEAEAQGFALGPSVLELVGLCPRCQSAGGGEGLS